VTTPEQLAERGRGPADPVNARPGVGCTSLRPYRLEVPAGTGEHTWEVPLAAPVRVEAGQELTWTVLPESAATGERRWDSTWVGVDAVLDDGTLLSATGAVDQYGQAPTPEAQGGGRRTWVDQWNLRRVGLDHVAGRRLLRLRVTVRSAPQPMRVFLDDVGVRTARPRPRTPLDAVDTTRGTHSSDRFSRGNTAPLVGLPHGGVFGLPMTDASRGNWPYAFHADNRETDNRPALQAFATSHLPSPWMGDRGVFQVMPSPLEHPDEDRAARALGFDHADELAGPHRYAVSLDGGVTAEVVPGDFALGMRFGLPGPTGSVILDHHGSVRSFSCADEGDETVVRALLDDRPGTPPHHVHLRLRGVLADRLRYDGERLGGHLTVATDPAGRVDVRLGISTVDDAQAAANLHDAGGVDEMAAAAEAAWERCLATVRVDGATADQLVSLYSGLHRVFLHPNRYGEGAGHAHLSPYDLSTVRSAPMSTTHGFWDTYRTAWPLLALLDPAGAGELAEGFVEHVRDGGWSPRWSAPGAQDCMTGTTFDTVLADLALRDVPGIDLGTGYTSVVRNATVPSADDRVGRKGLRPGIFRGHVDTETPEGLSWTLDNAINDWAAAQLARVVSDRGLAHPGGGSPEDLAAEREYFARRAFGYRSVFDTDRGFFIGRTPSGEWRAGEEFDPDEWGHDYTETNAWGTAFTAPHDGAGLAALHGGEQALGEALDAFFARPETGAVDKSGSYGFAIHEMTEARDVRMGMLGLSNQPAHHIPFMYMFAGRHDDAHRVVAEALDRLFVGSDLGQGYPGDEDNGEMSAWYVFATIGLYPLVPGTASYVLVPPRVRRTELAPEGGRPIVLESVGTGRFLSGVTVDGEPWTSVSLPHEVLARGAHVVYHLSEDPCGWARDSRPPSASGLSEVTAAITDVTVPGGVRSEVPDAEHLVDDVGERLVLLAPGDVVECALSGSSRLSLYTVTSARPSVLSWRIDYLDAGGGRVASEERSGETFTWSHQTRPFRVRRGTPATAAAVRFTALTACLLTQLEYVPAGHPRDNREGT